MVKFHESSFTHEYPFPTVTLAYFLRYPNPYSTHVLSTDTLSRHYDPETQTLYTARLHLKHSKIPSALYKLLPQSLLGPTSSSGATQSYILERSAVAMAEGIMVTESRNLEFTGILEARERQVYRRGGLDLQHWPGTPFRAVPGFEGLLVPEVRRANGASTPVPAAADRDTRTDVNTKVELYSRLGEARERIRAVRQARRESGSPAPENDQLEREEAEDAGAPSPPPKVGFLRAWSTSSIQRSIEAIGLRRTERAVPKSKEGMNVVLERMRRGGLVGVLEGMKRDREELMEQS